jgi:hypothetical protein
MSTDLTVQIVNFGTNQCLNDCLSSTPAALDVTPGANRVSVLNNGSRDDLSDLASYFSGKVDFFESPTNNGFGTGRDEEDLCPQVRRSARTVIYDPRVHVTHAGSVVARPETAHFARSTEHFTSKNPHALRQWRLSRAIPVGVLRHS